MGLVIPDTGLLIWMLITFTIVLWILGKYAWKPIMKSIKNREETIRNSLEAAKKAKEEIADLKEENKKIMAEARAERDKLLKEAKEIREKIIKEAELDAKTKADKMLEDARLQITSEKEKALSELKSSVAELTIEISEKILRKELSDKEKQTEYINSIVRDVKLN